MMNSAKIKIQWLKAPWLRQKFRDCLLAFVPLISLSTPQRVEQVSHIERAWLEPICRVALDGEWDEASLQRQATNMKEAIETQIKSKGQPEITTPEEYFQLVSALRYQVLSKEVMNTRELAALLAKSCRSGSYHPDQNTCLMWEYGANDPAGLIAAVHDQFIQAIDQQIKSRAAEVNKRYSQAIQHYNLSERRFGVGAETTKAAATQLEIEAGHFKRLINECVQQVRTQHLKSTVGYHNHSYEK